MTNSAGDTHSEQPPAQLTFLSKGIKPRTWLQRRAALQSILIGLAIGCGMLAVLIGIVYWWQS